MPRIAQPHAQGRIDAIAGIQQPDAARQSRRARPSDQIERDLGLGLEADVLGHACLGLAAPARAPWRAASRPTIVPGRRNATATDAAPTCGPARSSPPSAPRSSSPMAASGRRSSHATAAPDRHGRSRWQARQCRSPTAPRTSSLRAAPSCPLPSVEDGISATTGVANGVGCGLVTQLVTQ
jgi:hypothetical protein